jgi:hypothetical protein
MGAGGYRGLTIGTFVGGCQCSAGRYPPTAKKIIAYACHCLECQKQSASAFALSVPALACDLAVVGPAKEYKRPAASEGLPHDLLVLQDLRNACLSSICAIVGNCHAEGGHA